MKATLSSLFAAILLAAAIPSQAASVLYNINANGIKEVDAGGIPNGDPDGSAIGTILLDNGTGSGSTGSATINLVLGNIAFPLAAHHIHQAPTTTTGPVVVDFGNPETIRTGSNLSGTITGLPAAIMTGIFANPTGFYYNLHNGPFPGGAVRDQLPIPEPGTSLLLTGSLLGLVLRRRFRR